MSEFNKNHPEREEDEVFMCNCGTDPVSPGKESNHSSSFRRLPWITKRRGKKAYGVNGEPFDSRWKDSFPVFVKQSEINEKDSALTKKLLPDP